MNVTNLPAEERERLFNKWLEDNKAAKDESKDMSKSYDQYLVFGHDVDISKEEMENPDFIIPEWESHLPDWIQELASNVGKRCKTHDIEGVFLGITASYEDFYYRIMQDSGKISYMTCVAHIEFLDKVK